MCNGCGNARGVTTLTHTCKGKDFRCENLLYTHEGVYTIDKNLNIDPNKTDCVCVCVVLTGEFLLDALIVQLFFFFNENE